jgi:anti-anti-sigma factor
MRPRSADDDATVAAFGSEVEVDVEVDQPVEVPFEAKVVREHDHGVLVVEGEIDPSTAERFGASIDAALAQSPRIVIDLSAVTFMDSTGIRVLVQRIRRAEDGAPLALRDPSVPVSRLLTITGLDRVIPLEGEPVGDLQP